MFTGKGKTSIKYMDIGSSFFSPTLNAEFGVDESLSKCIGGILNLVYILAGLAVFGILYSEITKSLKNG